MLPSISLVLSVEMVRDGGSLAAVFQGSNGAVYWLFFPLRHQRLASGIFERLGYENPQVVERLTGVAVEISWQHAIVLLNQIRPLVPEHYDLQWLEAMSVTASTEGALPPGVERFLPLSA